MTISTLKAWAIGEKQFYPDDPTGKPPSFKPKRIYDSKTEAEEHVFSPYHVEEIEIDINTELDKLLAHMTPQLAHLMRTYRPEAIVRHLLGKQKVGNDTVKLGQVKREVGRFPKDL